MCIDKDDNTNEDEENIGSSVSPIVIPRIPSELWDEIILLCSQPTQAVLCRLSRHISICVIRRLYRDIVLQSASQVVRCCLTLAINSTAALLVRKLRFQYQFVIMAYQSICLLTNFEVQYPTFPYRHLLISSWLHSNLWFSLTLWNFIWMMKHSLEPTIAYFLIYVLFHAINQVARQ